MVKEDAGRGRKAASRQTHAVIDRVEDDGMAVLLVGEDEKTQVDIPVSLLPAGASGGDHLRISVTLDRQSRAATEDRVKKLQDELKQQSGGEEKKEFKL
jgi:hypothetical protein